MVSTTSGTPVQGHVEEGWGKVADAFRANFEGSPGEVGAACCVYVDGRPVVDLWGGLADSEANRPWDKDTIVAVASTTKGATAICAHLLVQRGELDLDAPVVKYWPEFGAAGKEQIPVRWLLSHQAGLPVVDGPLTFEEACAWHPVIRALEAQKPEWQPGTEHVYHSMTFGFLVGELVRRITGKSLGTFFAEEVAAPLGLSAWIGLPEEQEGRVARIEYAAPFTMEEMTAGMIETTGLDEATVIAWMNAVWGPDSVQARAGVLGGALRSRQRLHGHACLARCRVPRREHVRGRSIAGTDVCGHGERGRRRAAAGSGDGREDDRRPDRQDADERAAAGTGYSGRPLLLHVARVLAGLPADALGRARVVRPPRLRRIGRLRRSRCRCRLRLRHESVVVPDRRTTGVEPGRGGRGLPRVTRSTQPRAGVLRASSARRHLGVISHSAVASAGSGRGGCLHYR